MANDAGFAGPPVVVGHSMGGLVAIAAAAEFGDRLAGAVILDSPVRRPDPEEEEGAHGKAFRNPKVYPDVETALAPLPHRARPALLAAVHHRPRRARVARASRAGDGAPAFTWKFDPVVFRRDTPRATARAAPATCAAASRYSAPSTAS